MIKYRVVKELLKQWKKYKNMKAKEVEEFNKRLLETGGWYCCTKHLEISFEEFMAYLVKNNK